MSEQPNNPLHGKRLDDMLKELVENLGWEQMGYLVPINCFLKDPSMKSSLVFLRKTPWARAKVEKLYIERIIQFNAKK